MTVHITDLKSEMAVHQEILSRIERKVDSTNGRVQSLEIWRARLLGFSACFTALLIPMAFIVFGSFIRKIL